MEIIFIRHAKTEANEKNIWQGDSDLDLSERGKIEIENLKKNSQFLDIDIILSSPKIRAIKTARALIHKQKTKLITLNDLVERHFGDLELQKVDEIEKQQLADWELNTDLNHGVEKIKDMYFKRVKPFLLSLKNNAELRDKKIAIVSHSWIGRLISFFSSNEKDVNLIKIAPQNTIIYRFNI